MPRFMQVKILTNGKDSFTGAFCRSGGMGSLFTRAVSFQREVTLEVNT